MANTHSLALVLASSQYARNTSTAILANEVTNATLEGWMRVTSQPNTNIYYPLTAIVTSPNGTAGFLGTIRYNNTSDVFSINAFFGGTDGTWAINNQVLTNGVWYHLAVVKATTTVTVLLNGSPLTNTAVSGTALDWTTTSTGFTVGGNRVATPSRFSDATIDETRVWSTNRSTAEIAANMSKELVGTETNLELYSKLNNDYLDATGNGYTLTPSGSPVFSTDVPFRAEVGGKPMFFSGGGVTVG